MKGNTAILIIFLVVLGGSFFFSYYNLQQVNLLRQENSMLWAALDSLHHVSNAKPVEPKVAPAPTQPTRSTSRGFRGRSEGEKITISSKYRLEDRYVMGSVKNPEISGNEAGEVVLDIYVDNLGHVKSAKLKSAEGITNEDVIEACKKAALMTLFNSDLDMDFDERVSGTIIYTFGNQ